MSATGNINSPNRFSFFCFICVCRVSNQDGKWAFGAEPFQRVKDLHLYLKFCLSEKRKRAQEAERIACRHRRMRFTYMKTIPRPLLCFPLFMFLVLPTSSRARPNPDDVRSAGKGAILGCSQSRQATRSIRSKPWPPSESD